MKLPVSHEDPKKGWKQKIEIGVLCLLLPVAGFWVTDSARLWMKFRQAEKLYAQAEQRTHLGRPDEAVAYLEASVKACPEYLPAWQALGVAYHFQNDHLQEAMAYRRALDTFPNEHVLHRDLASAYHELGQHKAELVHLNIAAELPVVDPVFLGHLLKRANAEAAGTYPQKSRPATN